MAYHILLVEDEPGLREIIADYFSAQTDGCTLHTAADGAEAMEKLYEHEYDPILLDVMLPELDGFTLCRTVRRQSGVPILFLTARVSEEDKLQGYGLGADDYLTKPFSLLEAGKQRFLPLVAGGDEIAVLRYGILPFSPGRVGKTDFGTVRRFGNSDGIDVLLIFPHRVRLACKRKYLVRVPQDWEPVDSHVDNDSHNHQKNAPGGSDGSFCLGVHKYSALCAPSQGGSFLPL